MSDTDYSGYVSKGTRVLTGGDGVSYRFDPSSLPLELLLSGGPGPYGRFETLDRPADLASWLQESRLALTVPVTAADFRIRPAEFAEIQALRDTLWLVVGEIVHGRPPSAEDLTLINESAATTIQPKVDLVTGGLGWVTPITGAQVLGVVAREVIDFLVWDGGRRVRECAASDCRLVFLDTSRSRNRRWCSMERCGNRHKVRTYRARQDE